ncbi:MAG: HK97 gp10 family phage protein [Prevotella sp.]|jgi:Bacteriophage protein of unknown function (DUF646).
MNDKSIAIGELADTIMDGLKDYANLATEDMKKAVKDSAKVVRKEIQQKAPVGNTQKYKKSWSVYKDKDDSHSLELTVYSRNRAYLTQNLEKGHAKRSGGRVEAQPHIAVAEQDGITKLEEDITNALNQRH